MDEWDVRSGKFKVLGIFFKKAKRKPEVIGCANNRRFYGGESYYLRFAALHGGHGGMKQHHKGSEANFSGAFKAPLNYFEVPVCGINVLDSVAYTV